MLDEAVAFKKMSSYYIIQTKKWRISRNKEQIPRKQLFQMKKKSNSWTIVVIN